MNALAISFAMIPGRSGLGFGNGYGLAAPYFEGEYHWLVDGSQEKRRGAWYHWLGGFGAQLHSFEFRAPRAGEKRELFGHTFHIFQPPERRGLTVRTAWATDDPLAKTAEGLRELHQQLRDWRGHRR